jgi:hypothetical protein
MWTKLIKGPWTPNLQMVKNRKISNKISNRLIHNSKFNHNN